MKNFGVWMFLSVAIICLTIMGVNGLTEIATGLIMFLFTFGMIPVCMQIMSNR